jgi:hypothetical protein
VNALSSSSSVTHENTDISLQAIGVLYELTDEDVGEELIAEVGDEDEDDDNERVIQLQKLNFGTVRPISRVLTNAVIKPPIANLTFLAISSLFSSSSSSSPIAH